MPIEIRGKEYKIGQIFSDEFVFSVPVYQRPYAWTVEEAGELLDDLITSLGTSTQLIEEIPPYFLGSVVLVKSEDSSEAQIIDGQQRLVTLTILLSALRFAAPKQAGDLADFILEKGNKLRNTQDRYRLSIRERDAEFFKKHIQVEGAIGKSGALSVAGLTDPQKNMLKNALLFLDKLHSMDEDRRARLSEYLTSRCSMVVVSTPDTDSAYRIFSILNDRGLNLTHADILKAEVIGKIPVASQEEYAEKWDETEAFLGRDPFADLFSHIRMIKRREKLRGTILKEFREHVKPSEDPQNFIDKMLDPMAQNYSMILRHSYAAEARAEEVNELLTWLSYIDNVDWIPPALSYMCKDGLKTEGLIAFLKELDRLASCFMILRANINQRISRYAEIIKAIDEKGDLLAAGSPLQLTPTEKADVLNILEGSIYGETVAAKYILLRLDASLVGAGVKYDHPIITIEHVLPQTVEEGSGWAKWFPEEESRKLWTHRLANLVLLSRKKNSAAQNYDFDTKKKKYFAGPGGVSPFAITTQVIHEKEWTPQVLENRQKSLVAKLRELWQLG